jgi:hypothetical protein
MYTRSVMIFLKAALVLISVAIVNPLAIASDVSDSFQVVDGIAIYLGVSPAQILQGYTKEQPESRMHKGVPSQAHRDHVIVALFDDDTGQRIEDAKVVGNVMELGLASEQKELEPMTIAGTITYGNYFHMPGNDVYHIKLRIRLPDRPDVVEVRFTHNHWGK